MKKLNILFLSHASIATGFVVGSHQLARQFSLMGHTVNHVSSPVSLFNLFKGKSGRNKLLQSLFPAKESNHHWLVDDMIPFVPFPYGYHHYLDTINNYCIAHLLRKKLPDLTYDLVLIDQPLFVGLIKHLSPSRVIYRPTDIYPDMGGERFKLAEAKILELCKEVVATSNTVLSSLQIYGVELKRAMVLNNGVDQHFFSHHGNTNTFKRNGCVYVGAVDFRFDITFLYRLAAANPSIQFDIYGPVSIELPSQCPDNICFNGALDYLILPKTLNSYLYGIMPFNDHPANNGRSPMKLWEYHAAGLRVIAKMTMNEMLPKIPNLIYFPANYNEDNLALPYGHEIQDELTVEPEMIGPSWQQNALQILTFSFNERESSQC